MLYVAVTKAFEKTGLYRGARMVFVCLILFFWCAAVHLFGNATLPEGMGFFETIGYLYTRGVESAARDWSAECSARRWLLPSASSARAF